MKRNRMYKIINLVIALFFITNVYSQATVTSLSDDGSAGTLRWAINTANSDASINEIVFDSGLSGTLTLTSNLANITSNLAIIGPGVLNLIISGNTLYNMFNVTGGSVLTISGITFSNNASFNGSIFRADNTSSSIVASSISVANNARNYAFYTNEASSITISNSTFANNSGRLFGSDYGSTPTSTSDIESDYSNRITVIGSTFSSNTGTIFRTERYVKIDNCIFANNTGQIGEFRGLNRYQVLNSTFTNNGSTLFSFSSELSSTGWGLGTLGTNHHLFNGNIFTGNTGTVINSGSTNDQSKTTISNNTFTNNGTNWTGTPVVISANVLDNFITSISHSPINNTILVTMSRPVFNTNLGSGTLEANDFQFVLTGGNATLASSTPTSISVSGNTYVLGLSTIGVINGAEIIKVNPVVNSIYDASSNIAGAIQKNNTINLFPPASLSNFNPLTKTLYDSSFTITSPGTNSSGGFTFVSNNTAVATISGTTVSIVGPGVSTIIATQAADATHLGNTISTDLTVNAVTVVTKNGAMTNSNLNYVNKNGAIGASDGVNAKGESKVTKSN
jgi:hypothetical protein